MKKLVAFTRAVAMVGMVTGIALSAEGKAVNYSGTIVKVDGKTLVLSVKQGDKATEMKILTGDKTEVILDGNPAKLEDLKADMTAVVVMGPGDPQTEPVVPMAAKIVAKSRAAAKE